MVAAASTVVEWYDFTLYLYMGPVLARVFFGGGADGLAAVLATFAVGYLLRPVGGLAFGIVGDRWGRRPVMLASMAMMLLATAATAALPTAAQAGGAAALWLLALRCVMAFSVGGEYTGVMTYLLESSRPRRRGLVTSLAASSSEVGGLLAAGVAAFAVSAFSPAQVDEWGWRVPFVVGAVLAGAVLALRSTLPETPRFLEATALPAPAPLRSILAGQGRAVARSFLLSALCSAAYYVGIVYVPTYLTSAQGWDESAALGLATLAAAVVVVASPAAGWFSDRYGRRPVLIALGLASLLLPIPLFAAAALPSTAAVVAALAVLACLAGSLSAVAAASIPEQFAVRGRLTSLAIGGTVATTIFGGLSPYASQSLVGATGWPFAPGVLITAAAVAALPAIWFGPETADLPSLTARSEAVGSEEVSGHA